MKAHTFDVCEEHLSIINQALYKVEADIVKQIKLIGPEETNYYVEKLVELGNLQRVLKYNTLRYTTEGEET